MKKRWIISASVLIIIGLIGFSFNKFDLGNVDKISFEKEWTFNAQTLKNFTIEGNSENLEVKFVESSSDMGSIELEGKFSQKVMDRITETTVSDDSFHLDLTTGFEFHLLSLDFTNTKTYITVALPNNDKLDNLNVNISSGNMKIDNILANNASISTASGNLTVNNALAQELTLKTVSGNINAQEITSSNLNANVSSGNIKLTDISGELTAKATSGNITISQKEIGNADVKASSGNVIFNVAKGFSGFYDLQSTSGSIKAPDSIGTTTDKIKIRVQSGNIRVNE